jgi:hypothetical protein
MAVPPAELGIMFEHVEWRRTLPPLDKLDIGLDKKSLKQLLSRKALIECGGFLMNADDTWLLETFAVLLDDQWRSAMGPEPELDKLRYLAARLAAETLRAAGVNP